MMKKKRGLILALLVAVILLAALIVVLCLPGKKPLPQATVVEQILEYENLTECYLTSLGEYQDISVYVQTPTVTAEEVEAAIEETLEEYGETELTDAFVKEYLEVESVEAFRDQTAENLLENKKVELVMEARSEILKQLIERSEFVLNEDAVAVYAVDIVNGYEMEAYLYGVSLEEYSEEVLGLSNEEFFEMAYEEGAEYIKRYLVMGAIYNIEFGNALLEGDNIYMQYQDLENCVHSLFIEVGDDF